MPGVALQMPADRLLDRTAKTAFEQDVLPDFADWVIGHIRQLGPDYLVPVETKGARLLEAVLAHARQRGESIRVPLVYATALAYMDPDEIRRSRFLILDDAVNTGNNLGRHRERLECYGARDIRALVFMNHRGGGGVQADPPDPGVEAYREVDTVLYREYLWELADLVIARGLPPEVDHQVFTLAARDRLPVLWQRLRASLTRFGTLNVDGPGSRDEGELLPMTLHFPRLPGARRYPEGGTIRNEGASKIRFFPDRASGLIVVVPISFPTLDLPDGTSGDGSVAGFGDLVRSWAGPDDRVASLLAASVRRADPEAVFRMLSACTEVELMRGLARLLPVLLDDERLILATQRAPLRKLYGHQVGDALGQIVDAELQQAMAERSGEPAQMLEDTDQSEPVFLEQAIVEGTETVVSDLRALYRERAQTPGFDPRTRVGRTLSEVVDQLPNGGRLMASRCVGYGLAVTSLVPYAQVAERTDGSISVRREYRLSENYRELDAQEQDPPIAPAPGPNVAARHARVSEQVIALVARFVSFRLPSYRETGVPLSLVTQLVAILDPLVLEQQADVTLHVEARPDGPTLVIAHDTERLTVYDVRSQFFTLDPPAEDDRSGSEQVVGPTAQFEQLFKAGSTDVQLCSCADRVESWLERLVPLIADLDERERHDLLAPWAMNVDRRLGLTHVMASAQHALALIEGPLHVILRKQPHPPTTSAYDDARASAVTAQAKLEMLRCDWSEPVRTRIPGEGMTRDGKVLASLFAPSGCDAFGALTSALVEVTAALVKPVERLDEISAGNWGDGSVDVDDLAEIRAWSRRMHHALTSLGSDGLAEPPPLSGREAIHAAAQEVKETIELVRELAAGTTGRFRLFSQAPERATRRSATILAADIAGSKRRSASLAGESTAQWKDGGLDIVAQWACALGGWEGSDRKGDLTWLEFDDRGDVAVIAAAVLQEHLAALRSTGNDMLTWEFRCAVDDGDLQTGTWGNNTHAACIDRASCLVKANREDPQSVKQVLLTEDVANRCFGVVRGELWTPLGKNLQIIEDDDSSAIQPLVLDTAAVVALIARRAIDAARQIDGELGTCEAGDSIDTELTDGPESQDGQGQAEAG